MDDDGAKSLTTSSGNSLDEQIIKDPPLIQMDSGTGHDLTSQEDEPMTDQQQNVQIGNNNCQQQESAERKALRIPLIVDTILNFADFDTLEVCREVSSFFNLLSSTQIHRQHYLALRLNRTGEVEDGPNFDDFRTTWIGDDSSEEEDSPFSSDTEDIDYDVEAEEDIEIVSQTVEKQEHTTMIEEPTPKPKKIDRLQAYLASYGGSVQFKNLKLNLRISPRWSSTLLRELCTPFSHQVSHLRVQVDVHGERMDIVMETIYLFKNLHSLHLSFYGAPRRDLCQTDLFLQILRSLVTLKVDQIGWPSLLSLLKLGKEAPHCIKNLIVLDDALAVTPDFIKIYGKAVTQFGYKWTIPHIGLQLSNPSHLPILWKFLSCHQPTVQKLSLDLSYHRWNDEDEDETVVLNFPPINASQSNLTDLKMEYDHRDAVSFWARRFIYSLNLSKIEEIQLDDFYLHFPIPFDPTKFDARPEQNFRANWTPCSDHLRTILQIASGLELQKRYGEAMALHKKVFQMYKSTVGSKNVLTIEAHLALVYAIISHGDVDEGLSSYLELLKILKVNWNKNNRHDEQNLIYSLPNLCLLTMDGWTFVKKIFKKKKITHSSSSSPDEVTKMVKAGRTNLASVNKLASLSELQKLVKKFCSHDDNQSGEEGSIPLFVQLAEIYARALDDVHSMAHGPTEPFPTLDSKFKNSLAKLRTNEDATSAADERLAVFRTVFEIRPYNSKGVPAALGDRCGSGGDSGLPSSSIFYCGRERGGACRCGQCEDELCGPFSGCPCGSCVELLDCRVNRDNVLCKRGSGEWGTGGDTGLRPKEIFFCGRRRNECRCRGCDGCCGPNDGCPCNSCKLLLGER